MVNGVLNGLMLLLGMYSLIVIFSLIIRTIRLYRSDELQKKIFFETFSISMMIVLLLHLAQLIFSVTLKEQYHPVITSGQNSVVRFTTGSVDHFDSLLFYCIVIAITYNFRRVRFGLITKKSFFIRNLLPILIVLLFFLLIVL